MAAELALLRVSDPKGKLTREIVVAECTTMHNLHRVLQFCIKPRQADSVIDCKVGLKVEPAYNIISHLVIH